MIDSAICYEPNPKHKEPWHHGRSGTLCPRWSWEQAQQILDQSVVEGQQRYGVAEGMAFKGHEHMLGRWHGHPVAWNEVPPAIVNRWLQERRVTRREVKRLRFPEDLELVLRPLR